MVSFNYCMQSFMRDIVQEAYKEKAGWGICFQNCKMTEQLLSEHPIVGKLADIQL